MRGDIFFCNGWHFLHRCHFFAMGDIFLHRCHFFLQRVTFFCTGAFFLHTSVSHSWSELRKIAHWCAHLTRIFVFFFNSNFRVNNFQHNGRNLCWKLKSAKSIFLFAPDIFYYFKQQTTFYLSSEFSKVEIKLKTLIIKLDFVWYLMFLHLTLEF